MTMVYAPLTDDVLSVHAASGMHDQLSAWLPLGAVAETIAPCAGLHMHIGGAGELDLQIPAMLPARTATIGRYGCHVSGDAAWVVGGGVRAEIDLAAGEARVEIAADESDPVPALSLVAALLLARARRYLLHCAAVRAPNGTAWLLAGDSRAGKTSTALGLARVGWDLLSDDHVVLYRGDHGWCVDGWPRVLHPDDGWREGVLTGRRTVLDPRHEAGITLDGSSALHGVLLPEVVRGAERTALVRASAASALTVLLRQTAWSLADRAAAANVLQDLASVAALPAFHLRLAPDTYREPARLHELLYACQK